MLSKQEIRQLDQKALEQEILVALKDLFKRDFQVKSGQSKETHMLGNLKKYIARLKTIEREMGAKDKEKATLKTAPKKSVKKVKKA
jgi:ribosomal protein L29